jgi:hypothetical protein
MSRVANTYSLGSPTRICAASGRELRSGEPFVGALCQDVQTEEFCRQDYAPESWEGGARPAPPLELIGSWRGVVPDPNEKRRLLLDEGSLLDLFEQTGEDAPSADGAAARRRAVLRFVLALILVRKRLLVCEQSRGGTMLVRPRGVPRPPEGPPLVEVADPGMRDEDVALVTEQLQSVLIDTGAPAAPQGAGGAS